MTPCFVSANATIYNGPLSEVLPALQKVDAVITDPPYCETPFAWDTWPEGWAGSLIGVTSQIWCFGPMRMFMERASEFSGWKLAQDLVWEKHNGSSGKRDRFRRVHEHILHFYRGNWSDLHLTPQTFTVDDTKRGSGIVNRKDQPLHISAINPSTYQFNGTRMVRSVVKERSCHGYAVHPTQKPVDLLRLLIRYSVPPGGIVLDPFMGSGSTLVAAGLEGVRSIGIDINPEYCRLATQRLATP